MPFRPTLYAFRVGPNTEVPIRIANGEYPQCAKSGLWIHFCDLGDLRCSCRFRNRSKRRCHSISRLVNFMAQPMSFC